MRTPNGHAKDDFVVTRWVDRPRALVFSVVADVERYPEFVPGFADAHIRRTGPQRLEVMQRVGVKGVSVSFRSIAELEPPHRILIRSFQWPFKSLQQEWTLDETEDGKTRVIFSTRYALASSKLQRLVSSEFNRQLSRTIDAFERRLAGTPPKDPA